LAKAKNVVNVLDWAKAQSYSELRY